MGFKARGRQTGGRGAREGFEFQDQVLADRMLGWLIEAQQAEIIGAPMPDEPTFGIEISPSHGPEWDSLTTRQGASTLVEEVKSGSITGDDRKRLWKRIRRTYASIPKFTPCLTVDEDNPPRQSSYFKALPEEIGTAEHASCPVRVTSAVEMAQEALYYLTMREADTNAEPLAVHEARALMQGFEYQATSKEKLRKAIEKKLTLLSRDREVNELAEQLHGFLSRRAASQHDATHWFTPREFRSSVTVLDRLARVDPDAARLWQKLSSDSQAMTGTYLVPPGCLGYHPWQDLQKAAQEVIENPSCTRVALIAHGGMGKSVILRQLFRAQQETPDCLTLWLEGIAGIDSRRLEQALDLGCFLATSRGHMLLVLVDALENAAAEDALRALIDALGRGVNGEAARIIVTCRETNWRRLRGDQEEVTGWKEVQLTEWPEDLVRRQVDSSPRPVLDRKLLQLLRTPLFLDLFLQTFGDDVPIPPGLQTRYGILQYYFARRILLVGDTRSVDRIRFLFGRARDEAVARRPAWHDEQGQEMEDLASEGLFHLRGGRYEFRHPLLRDHALMLWVRDPLDRGRGDASVIAQRLSRIRRHMVRFGALRATLEAACAPSAGGDLVDLTTALATKPDLLREASEVLGGMDDLGGVDLRLLGEALPRDDVEVSRFGVRLIHAARGYRNWAWVRKLAELPAAQQWAEEACWIDESFLHELACLLQEIWRNAIDKMEPELRSACTEVARRLRVWSAARRLRTALDQDQGRRWYSIVDAVGRLDGTAGALTWLAEQVERTPSIRDCVLFVLPHFVARGQRDDTLPEPSKIADLYCLVTGWRREDGEAVRLLADPIRHSLLGTYLKPKEASGLIDALPEAFLPVAFEHLAAKAERQRKEREASLARLDPALFASFVKQDIPPEVRAAEESAERLCASTMSRQEAVGDLMDDVCQWTVRRDDLLNHLHNRLRHSRDHDGRYLRQTYWSAARASRSAAARVLLLDLLLEERRAVENEEIVDEIISDSRLYHFGDAFPSLWNAIRRRWPALPVAVRDGIIGNIRGMRRSPLLNGVYQVVGPLLDAVPEEDRPDDLKPFIEVYRVRGWDPRPHPPQKPTLGRSPDARDLWDVFGAAWPGLDETCVDCWRRVYRWNFQRSHGEQAMLVTALADIREVLRTNCLPTSESLQEQSWPLTSIQQLFASLAASDRQGREQVAPVENEGQLESSEVRALVQWALDAARSQTPEQVNADRATSGGQVLWLACIDFLNEALAHPHVIDDATLRQALLEEIRRMRPDMAPHVVRSLFQSIRPYHWFRDNDGRWLLRQILVEPTPDGGALTGGFELLGCFDPEERRQIIDHWFLEDGVLLETDASLEALEQLGQDLGANTLLRNDRGEPMWAKQWVEQHLETRPRSGLLAQDDGYYRWLSGIVFGAKEQIQKITLSQEIVEDFAGLMRLCWERIQSLNSYREENRREWRIPFGSWAFYWLFDKANGVFDSNDAAQVQSCWRALEPLARCVVATGSTEDIFHLAALPEERAVHRLGATNLLGLMRALAQRAEATPDDALAGMMQGLDGWRSILEHAANVAVHMAYASDSNSSIEDELDGLLGAWARRMPTSHAIVKARISLRRESIHLRA